MVVDNNMRIIIARSAVVDINVKAISSFAIPLPILQVSVQTPHINPRFITTKNTVRNTRNQGGVSTEQLTLELN